MRWLLLTVLALRLGAQQNSQVIPLQQTGWAPAEAGSQYQLKLVSEGCPKGQTCLDLTPGPDSGERHGVFELRVPAKALWGRTVMVDASFFVERGAEAAMQVRVEDARGEVTYRNSTLAQPVEGKGVWAGAMLPVEIAEQSETMVVGVLARRGRVVVAPMSMILPALPRTAREMHEPSSRLNRTALNNLMAFARLYGEVRYLYPSDGAAETDWFAFALKGVKTLDYAVMAASLGRRMQELFETVAPSVAIYVSTPPAPGPELTPVGKRQMVRWEHWLAADGVRSERKVEPVGVDSVADLRVVNLGRDLWARVPAVLFGEAWNIGPTVAGYSAGYSGDDRPTRLANVIVLWNLLRRFHPLAGQRQIDWDDMLARAMQQAAEDKDQVAFARTLQAMLARVDAEQEVVGYEAADREGYLPLEARWEGGRLVTPAGNAILGINGKSIAVLRQEAELYGERAWAELWRRGLLDLEVPVRMASGGGEKTVVMRYEAREGGRPAQPRSGVCQFVLPGGYSIVWPLAVHP